MPYSDFTDAHHRHWSDAERLFRCQRWANADHLYGLSAECGLKALLVAEGKHIDPPYKQHIDKLWPVFVQFIDGRRGSDYLTMLPDGEPFQCWRIKQRYEHQNRFDAARVEPHRKAAQAVHDMVQHAIQGGGS